MTEFSFYNFMKKQQPSHHVISSFGLTITCRWVRDNIFISQWTISLNAKILCAEYVNPALPTQLSHRLQWDVRGGRNILHVKQYLSLTTWSFIRISLVRGGGRYVDDPELSLKKPTILISTYTSYKLESKIKTNKKLHIQSLTNLSLYVGSLIQRSPG